MKNSEKKTGKEKEPDEERAKRFADEIFEQFQARRDARPNPLAAVKKGWSNDEH